MTHPHPLELYTASEEHPSGLLTVETFHSSVASKHRAFGVKMRVPLLCTWFRNGAVVPCEVGVPCSRHPSLDHFGVSDKCGFNFNFQVSPSLSLSITRSSRDQGGQYE